MVLQPQTSAGRVDKSGVWGFHGLSDCGRAYLAHLCFGKAVTDVDFGSPQVLVWTRGAEGVIADIQATKVP